MEEWTFVSHVYPLDTQLSAVDSLIDSMMLVEEDDNEEQKDMFKVHHIPNPAFQRHFQVLQPSLYSRDTALLVLPYSELGQMVKLCHFQLSNIME